MIIQGAGGGGKGGGGSSRTPVEAANTLRSKAFAQVLDAVCEGEIGGLVNGLQSVYLDGTPLQNPDGSFNFTDVSMASVNGTQAQPYIPGFTDVENEIGVGVEVKYATSITRQITNSNVNAVRVRLSTPQLTEQSASTGDINGASVDVAIDVQNAGGGFVPQPLSRSYSATGVSIVSGTAANPIPSYSFQVIVSYDPPQLTEGTAEYMVQRRLLGTSTWIDAQSGTFDTKTSGSVNIFFNLIGINQRGTTTATLDLPVAQYEFRVIKTAGSQLSTNESGFVTTLIGTQHGGTVSLSTLLYAVPRYADTISGKTTSKYERSYRISLHGTGPWDVRVRRVTADSTQATLANKTFFESYAELIEVKLRYPNTALVGVRIDAAQFQSIPTRSYDLKLIKVKIPSNYNPITRVYTGVWDGTFTVAWSDNPAWCFYDLLTNARYGLGGYINEAQVDKWALYTAGKYCDGMVPNGFGGTEPRFTCNLYLQSRESAYKVMQDMATIFRGMSYWSSGAVTVSQDAPADPAYLYTPANVADGNFSYVGSSAKARHSVALVTWNDPADAYSQKVEYVENTDAIARYGVIQTDIVAIGCTSRGQANRVGRWLLYTEQSESEVVAFTTGIEGAVARPGQVIAVSDPTRAGTRRGGRIVAASTTAVTVDAPIGSGMTAGTLSVIQPSGAVEVRTVASVAGSVVTVTAAFSAAPPAGNIWIFQSTEVQAQLFRVIACKEAESGFIEINALAYNPGKFDSIENGMVLQPRAITNLSLVPTAPENIIITESLYQSQVEVRTLVQVSWDSVAGSSSYIVTYRVDNGNYVTLPETSANSVDIRDAQTGVFTVRVIAVNALAAKSPTSEKSQQIFGKTLPPSGVTGFSLIPTAGMAYLRWDMSTDLDVTVGGTIRVRYTPDITAQTWNNSIDILPAISGNQNSASAPLLSGTYMAKFVDSSGIASDETALIVTTVPQTIALNVIDTLTESPSFAGVTDGIFYSPEGGGITLDSASEVDAMSGLIDAWEFIETIGGVAPAGTYTFAQMEDLGAVYPSRITASIRAAGFDTGAVVDYRLDDIDSWLDIDGAKADTANVLLYMRTTNDNPSVTPAWSDWKPFFVGEYTARGFQFQLRFTSGSATHNIAVSELSVAIDMPDRIEARGSLVSGAAIYSVAYAEPFHVAPAIGITQSNAVSGDYFTISNKTNAGFAIIFKDYTGATVSRTFDWMAKGYGRRVSA